MQDNFYDVAYKIDNIIKEYSPKNLEKIESYFKHEGIKLYVLRKLVESKSPSSWLKPLKEKGYFNPEIYPITQEVLYWSILNYLENVANKNMKEPSEEITNTLIDIVNSIINYRDEKGKRIENFRTDWFMVKIISTLPVKRIKEQYIEFIRIALKTKWDATLVSSEIGKTFIPKLIKEQAKYLLLELLDVIFDYKKVEKDYIDKYVSIMDNYWLFDALKKHKHKIAELCSIEAAEIALKYIKSIIQKDKSQFNNIWIPTIEDHPQNSFPDRYECQLVHFVRDMFELTNANQIRERIKKLLKEEYPIFKRIAIHTINHHYKDLNDIFWNWSGNPLDAPFLKHEIYELLKSNCLSFSKKQIEKIIEWIELKDYYISNEIKNNKEQIEKRKAYHKREWLSALLQTNNPRVIERYKKYEEINPAEFGIPPGFDTWSESSWGNISPIEEDELYKKSNIEIAKYLISYAEADRLKGPSKEGLADVFRISISNKPEKFTLEMEPFQNIHRMYQDSLLRGLWEAWRTKKSFNWENTLTFILKIIESKGFWKEKYTNKNDKLNNSVNAKTEQYDYHDWIISAIAELIEEGTKNDNHAFDSKLLPLAERILLILIERAESDFYEVHNLVTSVSNSTKGKIYSAMVNYSLRYSRLYMKDREDRWVDSIKKDFTKRLDRRIESSPIFSVILGQYLPNLYYLDKKWVIDNINKIFPKDNDIQWESAFTGYLFYSRVYKEIYFLLSKNEHYVKALEIDFQDENITKQLVHHICISFIEDWEKLDDKNSLISRLIENNNVNQISEIVSFFWMWQDRLTNKIKSKVKPLWKVLFEMVSQNEKKQEYQKIISNLSKWLYLIDEIDDEVKQWLMLSARYIEKYHNTSFFVEYLYKHVEKTPEKVGRIYLEILNYEIYPFYKKEDIKGIVQILYEKEQKEFADKICNKYGEKGFYFLRDIYEKFRIKI